MAIIDGKQGAAVVCRPYLQAVTQLLAVGGWLFRYWWEIETDCMEEQPAYQAWFCIRETAKKFLDQEGMLLSESERARLGAAFKCARRVIHFEQQAGATVPVDDIECCCATCEGIRLFMVISMNADGVPCGGVEGRGCCD